MSESIASVGNVNLDIIVYVDELPGYDEAVEAKSSYIGLGGAATNHAVAVALLGLRSVLVARVGSDAASGWALEELRKKGVSVDYVKVVDGESIGIALIMARGPERRMICYRAANRYLSASDVEEVHADLYHFASVHPDLLQARVEGLLSYDPGSTKAKLLGELKRKVTVIHLNTVELREATGSSDVSSAKALLSKAEMVVVKAGAKGAYLVTESGIVHAPAYAPGEVVDTTGAGDIFDAAFNASLVEGYSPREALVRGVVAAGIKVCRRGAQAAPRRDELEEHIERYLALHGNLKLHA